MPIVFSRYITLRTILGLFFILTLSTVLVGYILFQARHIIAGPTIVLFPTREGPLTQATTTVRGKVENITEVTLNDRIIYTDDEGYFEEVLVLPPGYTIMTLKAQDRYGRERSLSRTYVRLTL